MIDFVILKFCNFEIADSTAAILSGSRLFLEGGGFLSGETFFVFGLSWSFLTHQQFPFLNWLHRLVGFVS